MYYLRICLYEIYLCTCKYIQLHIYACTSHKHNAWCCYVYIQNKTDEVDEIANQIKESIVDGIAGLNRLQIKVDEISQEIKEHKSSYEDALQNVENLHVCVYTVFSHLSNKHLS